MPELIPFGGYRFDPSKVGDMTHVVCPPYDIISTGLQEILYDRSPHNIVRLELGRSGPNDSETNNRYTRAAVLLDQWIRDQVLVQETRPSLYVIAIDYTVPDGRSLQMRGIMSSMKLERFGSGKVFPHEDTFSKPKADRIQLLRATKANLSPIFGLYSKSGGRTDIIIKQIIESRGADVEVHDEDKNRHRLWVLQNTGTIQDITKELLEEPVYIADGHHRYETALLYRHEMREKTGRHGGNEPFDSILMFLANMENDGLTILPTHRVIGKIPDFNANDFLTSLKTHFTVSTEKLSGAHQDPLRDAIVAVESAGRKGVAFGAILDAGRTFGLLTLSDPSSHMRPGSEASRLDVALLQDLVIDRCLGLKENSPARDRHLSFCKDPSEGYRRLQSGDAQVLFLLNATKMDELRRVASNGERMPQKSTYFYPKLQTGLVIHKHT